VELGDWTNVSAGHWNLAELHVFLGDLRQADRAASEAIAFARRAAEKADSNAAVQAASFAMMTSLAYSAWVSDLRGDLETATAGFEAAQEIERRGEPGTRFLYSNRGVFHADHLRRMGETSRAFAVATANLERCKRNHWVQDVSRNHRILGDLALDAGNVDAAHGHYEEALLVARRTSFRPALIEALVGRARLARSSDSKSTRIDLEEALDLTTASGYALYELDVRLMLAGVKQQSGEVADARLDAERVLRLSNQMQYHWGRLAAEAFLSRF
jgi:tetratricopeptide (TPR) repeat protein